MARPLDPLGKRALFWLPVDSQVAVDPEPGAPSGPRAGSAGSPATGGHRRARPTGRHALFSAATPASADGAVPVPSDPADPLPEQGILTVACSACGAVTRVGVLDFLLLQLPVPVWVPGRTFDHRMRCPACRRRTWTGVTISS